MQALEFLHDEDGQSYSNTMLFYQWLIGTKYSICCLSEIMAYNYALEVMIG